MKYKITYLLLCVMLFTLTDCKAPILSRKKKPIIYVYPTTETNVQVKLEVAGELIHTYPRYNEKTGWQVKASPDGTLVDEQTGRSYYALFWESLGTQFKKENTGFVVKGSETIAFLEEKLAVLGLSEKEANEFIVYWLPEMENNAYNYIHFAEKIYTDQAKLEIIPAPETLIRVFMLFEPLKSMETVNPQVLKPVTRKGFTVVEWGGTDLSSKEVN